MTSYEEARKAPPGNNPVRSRFVAFGDFAPGGKLGLVTVCGQVTACGQPCRSLLSGGGTCCSSRWMPKQWSVIQAVTSNTAASNTAAIHKGGMNTKKAQIAPQNKTHEKMSRKRSIIAPAFRRRAWPLSTDPLGPSVLSTLRSLSYLSRQPVPSGPYSSPEDLRAVAE